MTESLLDLGFSFGCSYSVDFWQILPSFSISCLFFMFFLDVARTSLLVIARVIFCAFAMLLIEES